MKTLKLAKPPRVKTEAFWIGGKTSVPLREVVNGDALVNDPGGKIQVFLLVKLGSIVFKVKQIWSKFLLHCTMGTELIHLKTLFIFTNYIEPQIILSLSPTPHQRSHALICEPGLYMAQL